MRPRSRRCGRVGVLCDKAIEHAFAIADAAASLLEGKFYLPVDRHTSSVPGRKSEVISDSPSVERRVIGWFRCLSHFSTSVHFPQPAGTFGIVGVR